MGSATSRQAFGDPNQPQARAIGALLIAATALVAVSLALPHPEGNNEAALGAIAAAMGAAGILCLVLARRMPLWLIHGALAAPIAATGLLIYESGVAAGQYGAIFVWATLIASYFFSRRVAVAHLLWLLGVYAVALAAVKTTAGYSPLTRWLFTAMSLSVVTTLMGILVVRRSRADTRAQSFFDLSYDMLCTANLAGYFVELNDAWQDELGYTFEELRARPFLELVHPEDRKRTETEAANLFNGTHTVDFENRYLAKDGSWHWFRWSATANDEKSLIYARATDVTERKHAAAEKERLLIEVEALAHLDSLTGLPNRRALDERMGRDLPRARRLMAPLWVALLDLDHFKDYNDAHGHRSGDQLLQRISAAWDSELRGGDFVARYGGEEFVVVLPDCTEDQAQLTVERVRGLIPEGQTCSAGLARWDFVESAEDLLERADAAMYEAKGRGRDRLICAEIT